MFITLSQIANYLGMNLKMSFGGDLHASLQLPKELWSRAQTLLKKKGLQPTVHMCCTVLK